MKKHAVFCRTSALVMSLVLGVSDIAGTGFAMTALAADTQPDKKISGLGTGEIEDPALGGDTVWDGDYVYFGEYGEESVKYRVLDKDSSLFGGDTMLLDCDTVLYYDAFDSFNGQSNWSVSTIRRDLNDKFYKAAFSAVEKEAIAESKVASHALNVSGNDVNVDSWTADAFKSYVALSGEKIFLLDAEDVCNPAYGYGNTHYGFPNRNKTEGAEWWLRSANRYANNLEATVDQYGRLNSWDKKDTIIGVSPALNVDLSSVIFSSLVKGEEDTYKLTLLDEDMTISLTGSITRDDMTFTIPYTISGNHAGKVNRVSVLITDKEYKAGEAVTKGYTYLKLDMASFGQSGTGSFTLPAAYEEKTCGADYHVYILAEDVNGEKESDNASGLFEITALPEKPVVEAEISAYDGVYDGASHAVSVNVTKPAAGAVVKYGTAEGVYDMDESPSITNVSESPLTVYYNITAKGYKSVSGSEIIKISEAGVVITEEPAANELIYNGSAQELVKAGTAEGGTFVYGMSAEDSLSANIPTGTDAGAYTVYYKVAGDANHSDSEVASIDVVIAKADQTAPKAPVAASVSTDNVVLVAHEGYEYKCGEGQWQESNVFGSLRPGEEYRFFQRLAEDANHNASESSPAALIRTEGGEQVEEAELRFTFEGGSASFNAVYTGGAITPVIEGTFGDKKLTEGVDYKVKYSNNVNAGKADVKVNGLGVYEGSRSLSFTILPKQLDDGAGNPDDEIVVDGLIVKGNAKVKPILIYNGNTVSNKQYTAECIKAEDGTETVSITAAENGNFSGSITGLKVVRVTDKAQYKDHAIKVSMGKVSRIYNGEPQYLTKDELKVSSAGGNELKENTDYVVSYSADIVNAGTVKVKVVGIGEYTGTYSKTYRILPAKDAVISVKLVQESGNAEDTYSYIKGGVTPAVIVSAEYDGKNFELLEGRDYSLSYKNNAKAGAKATVKLKMLGNFKGAKAEIKSFTVDKAGFDTAEIFVGDLQYKKAGKYKAVPVVTIDGKVVDKSEYSVTYTVDGEAMPSKLKMADDEFEKDVVVTIRSNSKSYKDGEVSANYCVYKNETSVKDISKAKVSLTDRKSGKAIKTVAYTGREITFDPSDENRQADISVKIDKSTTLSGTEVYRYFDVSYADNILKGKGTIILTAKKNLEGGNPYSGARTTTFTIAKRSMK